jgi:thioredoxin 1
MPFVRPHGTFRPHGTSVILTVLVAFAFAAVPARSAERDIYPAPDQAKIDLAAALVTSAATHKRVILDFGGNWCPDCHVLDLYFHDAANGPILEANYILVYVNIGRKNENLDIAERYQIPLRKGVPALAVLGERGELLYSQRTGEFEAMRGMHSSAVTDFLVRWKHPSP